MNLLQCFCVFVPIVIRNKRFIITGVGIEERSVTVSSVDYLLRNGSWESVEEQSEEQHRDEDDQGDDDVLLVVPPNQVEEAFERIDKP